MGLDTLDVNSRIGLRAVPGLPVFGLIAMRLEEAPRFET